MKNNIKLAIQKSGRLSNDSTKLLKSAGFQFEVFERRLFTTCRNYPLEIIYSRDDDICNLVVEGIVDIGIVGQNLVNEKRLKVKKLLNLRFGFCSLAVAIPKKSKIKQISDLNGLTIAATYTKSAQKFLKDNNITAKLIKMYGGVEAAPTLGTADAIIDLVSSGSTLAMNDLKILTIIYNSEAVLIANAKSMKATKKNKILNQILLRFKGILSAKTYKYISLNTPKKILPKLKKKLHSPVPLTIRQLMRPDWINVQCVIKEDVLWDTTGLLKKLGVTNILVLPIEKIIN